HRAQVHGSGAAREEEEVKTARMASRRVEVALLAAVLLLGSLRAAAAREAPGRAAIPPSVFLRDGRSVQSSAEVTADRAAISRPRFRTAGWTPATLPTTVLAALVASGEVREPYFGRNLETIPTARFAVPWWFRTEITVEDAALSSRLVFHGIDYSAEVWL